MSAAPTKVALPGPSSSSQGTHSHHTWIQTRTVGCRGPWSGNAKLAVVVFNQGDYYQSLKPDIQNLVSKHSHSYTYGIPINAVKCLSIVCYTVC